MGGAERSLIDIVSGIQGFEPVFVTPSAKLFFKFKSIGIRCIYFPTPLKVLKRKRGRLFSFSDIYDLPSLILRFVKLLKREKPSLVYTNSQKAHLIGVIASKFARIPCISHFRDILPKSVIINIWLHLFCLLTTRIIVVSKAVARGLPHRTKVKVIYNGIKLHNSRPPTHDLRLKTVGYVGQIARWKGVEYFIKAASLLIKELPETNFIIVGGPIFGDTEYLKELKELSFRRGLDSKLQFIGEKDNALPYIDSLDILVHPAVEAEPFGRVLIEAGSLGKPVVATSVGAIPEIVEHGVTGILVPPRDFHSIASAVRELINDPQLAKTIGEKVRERVAKCFNLDNMIKEIEKVMRETIV